MKILHTADWHIGKVLHKQNLREEMLLFLDWLLSYMEAESIDVLLISGDIFDLANPSIKDRQVYYHFLSQMIGRQVKVVITGGNHDSIGLLDAPQEILAHLDITVVGGARSAVVDELVPVLGDDDEVILAVAAVPFLRDRDLRAYDGSAATDRVEAIRAGIAQHYQDVADACKALYPGVPSIAMGHLYARGASTSESERDIHVGNAAAVESSVFTDYFEYVALGHIHRPQRISGSDMIRYSGSPIALSFSEREDKKCVLVIDLKDGVLQVPRVVDVPKFRELRRFSGSLAEVRASIAGYSPDYKLPSFVDLEITEPLFSASILADVDAMVSEDRSDATYRILKARTHFLSGAKDTSELFEYGTNIEDLRPVEVFTQKVEQQAYDDDSKALLHEAFQELLEAVQQGEQETNDDA